jgi:hypothetical protein
MDNDEEFTITLSDGETIKLNSILDTSGDITIDLNQHVASTSYAYDPGTLTLTSGNTDFSYTIGASDTITFDNIFATDFDSIKPDDVEKMCSEYPALEKVWRNFKSVYDMVKQDYEGKKRAGELDE